MVTSTILLVITLSHSVEYCCYITVHKAAETSRPKYTSINHHQRADRTHFNKQRRGDMNYPSSHSNTRHKAAKRLQNQTSENDSPRYWRRRVDNVTALRHSLKGECPSLIVAWVACCCNNSISTSQHLVAATLLSYTTHLAPVVLSDQVLAKGCLLVSLHVDEVGQQLGFSENM